MCAVRPLPAPVSAGWRHPRRLLITRADNGVGFIDKQQHRLRDFCTASITFLSRCSNSPLTPRQPVTDRGPVCGYAPFSGCRHVAFGDTQRQPFHQRGFAPPGSPTRIGLFLRRRERISTSGEFRCRARIPGRFARCGLFRHVFGKAVKHRQQGVILFPLSVFAGASVVAAPGCADVSGR